MNLPICVVLCVGLLGMCSYSGGDKYVRLADQLIEYQLEGDQYAVVVVMDGLSASEAKKIAMKRAAEIVVQQGDRYFTVDTEQETSVIKSDDDLDNQRFYGNMYQELIIEGDFNRDRLRYRSLPNTSTYSAFRLVFTSFKDKPGKKAIDACTLTNCQ